MKASDALSAQLDAEEAAASHRPTIQPAKAQPVDVTVIGNYQVYYEGLAYGPDDTVAVPPELAGRWQLCGWVAAT
jgi:hypothetical protein